MPNINKVVEKIPSAFTGMMIDECFFNEPKCRVRMEVEILYPASERDKDCNEQPKHAQKINGSARIAN
jgi:hypothetical protein